jgi:hypothetical protein
MCPLNIEMAGRSTSVVFGDPVVPSEIPSWSSFNLLFISSYDIY